MSVPGDAPNGAREGGRPYLSVCTIYRDEAPYLREWIEFHRLQGVERFFLYDNLSRDDHREQLAPYLEEGIAVLHDWPVPAKQQIPAYEDALRRHRDDSRWIAFVDIDEFLFCPPGGRVADALVEYEPWPGIAVNWCYYGTSGHLTRPDGLVIENYVWRGKYTFDPNRQVKCIVDPSRVIRVVTPHQFEYVDGPAVDEHKQAVEKGWTRVASYTKLRINHYKTRSKEEYRIRCMSQPNMVTGDDRAGHWDRFELLDDRLSAERDEILVPYAPAVREALARVEERERAVSE